MKNYYLASKKNTMTLKLKRKPQHFLRVNITVAVQLWERFNLEKQRPGFGCI